MARQPWESDPKRFAKPQRGEIPEEPFHWSTEESRPFRAFVVGRLEPQGFALGCRIAPRWGSRFACQTRLLHSLLSLLKSLFAAGESRPGDPVNAIVRNRRRIRHLGPQADRHLQRVGAVVVVAVRK